MKRIAQRVTVSRARAPSPPRPLRPRGDAQISVRGVSRAKRVHKPVMRATRRVKSHGDYQRRGATGARR